MSKVVLTGFAPDLNLIALAFLIRDKSGMRLHKAKAMIDALAETHNLQLAMETDEHASVFLAEAEQLGFFGHVEGADRQEK